MSGPQLQSQPVTPSTEDWLIASSVITEEKIRWTVNGFLQQRIETLVCHYVKYSRLVWLSAMFPKLGKK
jgi:hypothetical protein